MEVPRVNSMMLRQYVGRLVCLVGKVEQINSNGSELKILTSDDKTVHVVLSEPLEEAVQGVVEIIGKVERDGSIGAQRLIMYGGTDDFDLNLYDQAIKLTTNFPDMFAATNTNGF